MKMGAWRWVLMVLAAAACGAKAEAPRDEADLRPLFYPARNQLFRGSCAAFASVAAMEFYAGSPRLSEAYVYSLIKENSLNIEGANLAEMKSFLEQNPLVAQDVFPYEFVGSFGFNANEADEVRVAKAFNRVKGEQARILRDRAIYQAVDIKVLDRKDATWDFIRQSISDGKPVVAGFRINAEHWKYAPGGRIDSAIGVNGKGEKTIFADNGGHAVLIVGYTRDGRLIIRNSWGIEWGDQGYGYLHWEHYARHKLRGAMVIGGVRTAPNTTAAERPDFDIRAQGKKMDDGTYSANLSYVLKSKHVPEGGIRKVKYYVYSPQADLSVDPSRFPPPLAVAEGDDALNGFRVHLDDLRVHSLKVIVEATHHQGGISHGYRPIPEIVAWSPLPLLDGMDRK